jgi:hypothetical protein
MNEDLKQYQPDEDDALKMLILLKLARYKNEQKQFLKALDEFINDCD